MKVAIIGGGAAGFFSAINLKENYPEAHVFIFEKKSKFLSKVKISGGGRCNVTNACKTIEELCSAYPRGGKSLKKAFHQFNNHDLMKWFEKRGIALTIQSDNCVFPKSQDSQSIIDCLIHNAKKLKIELLTNYEIKKIITYDDSFELQFSDDSIEHRSFDKVIVTTGGSPKKQGLTWLENLGHQIIDPVPSLFTFNVINTNLKDLMGIVVNDCLVNIQSTKLKAEGAVLITHWGLSGPAILKLSSFGARQLFDMDYQFKVYINWIAETNQAELENNIQKIAQQNADKKITNYRPYNLPDRLWIHLLNKCDLNNTLIWKDLTKKHINKLINIMTNDIYEINGKSTFKEEFVTAGGVSLKSVDMNSMQSKICKNLYLAGEVLDIDGITGGYNLQAAWTTGYIAGQLA